MRKRGRKLEQPLQEEVGPISLEGPPYQAMAKRSSLNPFHPRKQSTSALNPHLWISCTTGCVGTEYTQQEDSWISWSVMPSQLKQVWITCQHFGETLGRKWLLLSHIP